jgi:flagellar biosynthesis/type III secretory pathway protein FliH
MKRTRMLSASLALLIATSSVAAAQGRGRGRGDDKDKDRGRDRDVPQQEQQRRIQEEHQRADQYKARLEQQMRDEQREREVLQQDRRAAQYAAQQRYEQELREQQRRSAIARDYDRDPYIRTPHSYRYSVGGANRVTNQYGAEVLKRAVNYGYQQGHRAGEADHQDRWKANYQNSIGYRDADYGYDGNYVDLSDYNYYFRQGFQRGYDDGYNHRSEFGTSTAGVLGIAAAVLAGILVLKAIN